MALPNYKLFTELLETQQRYGIATIECTAHTAHSLRAALAALRRQNPSLFAVQLGMQGLLPHEIRIAQTGGQIAVRVTLKAKAEGAKAQGVWAQTMREAGLDVDRQTEVQRGHGQEPSMEEKIAAETRAYEIWLERHPDATYEEKAAAGFKWYADDDIRREEVKKTELVLVKPKEDFYAELNKDVLRDDFDPTKTRDEQVWKKDDK